MPQLSIKWAGYELYYWFHTELLCRQSAASLLSKSVPFDLCNLCHSEVHFDDLFNEDPYGSSTLSHSDIYVWPTPKTMINKSTPSASSRMQPKAMPLTWSPQASATHHTINARFFLHYHSFPDCHTITSLDEGGLESSSLRLRTTVYGLRTMMVSHRQDSRSVVQCLRAVTTFCLRLSIFLLLLNDPLALVCPPRRGATISNKQQYYCSLCLHNDTGVLLSASYVCSTARGYLSRYLLNAYADPYPCLG